MYMQCNECGARVGRLDNDHLLRCCGLTLHEYGLRHGLPLDLLVPPDLLNEREPRDAFERPRAVPRERARSLLWGLSFAGLVRRRADYREVPVDIRRLDLALWALTDLRDYGFRFCQEYRFDRSSNRVVADNTLRALADARTQFDPLRLSLAPPPDFAFALAVCVAFAAELHAGYLFLPVAGTHVAREIRDRLRRDAGIDFIELDAADAQDGCLLRARTPDDSAGLFAHLEAILKTLPGVWQRFHDVRPQVTVVKEVVFDAAHFITDHPAKCSNLHGGRYRLQVKVGGGVDPATGCVIDYGYLKRVVNRRVVDCFDHHTLNYVAAELAWRSSTELLCIYIWERLIDHLPGLQELQLYETEQSWCHYRGPALHEFQVQGGSALLRHFTGPGPADPALRRALVAAANGPVGVVA